MHYIIRIIVSDLSPNINITIMHAGHGCSTALPIAIALVHVHRVCALESSIVVNNYNLRSVRVTLICFSVQLLVFPDLFGVELEHIPSAPQMQWNLHEAVVCMDLCIIRV